MVDVITLIPKEARYKIWENLINKNRALFEDVIVVFTEASITGIDHSGKTRAALFGATCIYVPQKEGDWRDIATNFAIDQSRAENILFLEPDFFIASLDCALKDLPQTLGVKIDGRLHPCFLRVSRENIEKTDRDFAAYPDEGIDHFGKFTSQLRGIKYLQEPYYHMAGLTHNMKLEARGEKISYKPDEYKMYSIISEVI